MFWAARNHITVYGKLEPFQVDIYLRQNMVIVVPIFGLMPFAEWDLHIWNIVKILRCNWSRLNDMDILLTRFNTQYECIVHKCWCKFSAFSWMISLIEFHGWADCSNWWALHWMNWSFASFSAEFPCNLALSIENYQRLRRIIFLTNRHWIQSRYCFLLYFAYYHNFEKMFAEMVCYFSWNIQFETIYFYYLFELDA